MHFCLEHGWEPLKQILNIYAHPNPLFANGSVLILSPVAAKIAFVIAGIVEGSAGSPKPVGGLSVMRQLKCSVGTCRILNSGCWW